MSVLRIPLRPCSAASSDCKNDKPASSPNDADSNRLDDAITSNNSGAHCKNDFTNCRKI